VATGNLTSGGFVVYKGSEAVVDHLPSATYIKHKREALVTEGVLEPAGDRLVFSRDYEFASPSSAGSGIRGVNTNGLTSWKNAEGVVLKHLEANE
jgi:predicted type IV restriction endonuclease